MNDDVDTNALVSTVVALPVFTVILNCPPPPLVNVITLLATDAVIRAFEAEVWRATTDEVILDVKFNILEVNEFILPV